MKKVVVFGGGTGLSCLLSGLKMFPMDVTTVISVSDNGSSTGVLKEELNIPAVGDVGKVLISMANVDKDLIKLMGYRFNKGGTLHNHPVRNIILAALIDIKGSLKDAAEYMCKLLNVKGTILPLTEEKVELVGESIHGAYFGEEEVSQNIKYIQKVTYDHDIKICNEIRQKILDANLIIFSPGSLYTSIIPHLIAPEVREALEETKAPLMYVCNLVTQPGETDGYNVSDHIGVLNRYLGERKVDIVLANDALIDERIVDIYQITESKTVVELDLENIEPQEVEIIAGRMYCLENDSIRHDALKTAYKIFSYLMDQD